MPDANQAPEQVTQPATQPATKQRAKRAKSLYVAITKDPDKKTDDGMDLFRVVDTSSTPNKLVAKLVDQQLEGEFTILCSRRAVKLVKSVSIKVAG